MLKNLVIVAMLCVALSACTTSRNAADSAKMRDNLVPIKVQVPSAVASTLAREAGDAMIVGVQRMGPPGKGVFFVTVLKKGRPSPIVVSGEGKVLTMGKHDGGCCGGCCEKDGRGRMGFGWGRHGGMMGHAPMMPPPGHMGRGPGMPHDGLPPRMGGQHGDQGRGMDRDRHSGRHPHDDADDEDEDDE